MSIKVNTPLETLVHFSDFKTEKISSIQIELENNKSLKLAIGKDVQGVDGVNFTLINKGTGATEITAFMKKSDVQGFIKVINAIYRQIPTQ